MAKLDYDALNSMTRYMMISVFAVQPEALGNERGTVIDEVATFLKQQEERGVVVRGLRVYSDFEYEFQMALTNRKLAPEIETLFMMPNENYSYVTASTIREIARYGGDTDSFVPRSVKRYIEAHMCSHPEQHVRAGGGVGNTGAFDR